MGKIKVICTSTGCIEYAPERYRELGIDILRIHVFFNGNEYREGLDLDPVAFYRELETIEDPKNHLPSTGMPETEEIRACFERALDEGCDEVMVFALSSALGGTYNKICLVAKEYEDRLTIHAIDTKITCFGEGLLAIKAATWAKEGKTSEEILREIRWMMKHQEFIGVDGKLDYLIYNGRLKGGKAFMGQMLNICPVIHFSKEGEIVPLESVRTQKKALARTCELLRDMIGDRAPGDYLLWHIYTGPSLLEQLLPIEKKYGIETNHEAVIMSPVSGAHNGPWLAGYGLAFLRRDDEPLEDGE
ncbi:MAG: DegV family protein [Ruminococcaceae bacterium]|nr:DegV family protein [Oscillospiraceae bacterium]